MKSEEFYLLAIHDRDMIESSIDFALSCRLSDAGYDIGPMLWTASPDAYPSKQKMKEWKAAFKRAGIIKIEQARDNEKNRYWFKVYPPPKKQPQRLV